MKNLMMHLKNFFNNIKQYSVSYYYLFIFLITTYYSLRTSSLQSYPIQIFLFLAGLLYVLKMLCTHYQRKEIFLIFLILLFGIINTYFSSSTLTLIVVCVITGAKGVDINKSLKIILFTKIVIACTLCILSLSSVIENVEVLHNRGGNVTDRYSLGYEHPNVIGKILFQCVLIYFILYKDKYKKFDWVIILILNFILFSFTKSRTPFLIVVFSVLGIMMFRIFKDCKKKKFYKFITIMPIFMMAISYIIPKYIYPLYNKNEIFMKFDSLLQYRLTFSHIYLYRFDSGVFGQPLRKYWSDGYAFLDSGYLNLLLGGGIIFTLLFIIGYYFLTKKLIKDKEDYVLFAIFCILIYSFTENILYSFFYNFTFIYISEILFKKKISRDYPKICVINTVNMGFNGISKVIMNHYRYQKKLNWKFVFVCNYYIEKTFKEEIINNHDRVYVLNKKKAIILYIFDLMKLVMKEDFDIIHVHGNSSFMILESIISKFSGGKIIVHCHNSSPTSKMAEKYLNGLFKKTYNLALACSNDSGEWIFGKNKFKILNNGIEGKKYFYDNNDRNNLRNKLNLNDKKVIIQVGRLNELKNHIFFLTVLKKLSENSSDYMYMIVGDGQLKKDLQNKVKALDLEKYVMFVGESKDIAKYYSASDIFVLPSLSEGLGIVLVEAQANGIPCIVSTNVPQEACYTKFVKYVDLDVEKWVNELKNMSLKRNEHAVNDFNLSDFDFYHSAELLKEIYLKLLEDRSEVLAYD